jgi:hypothetical protein
MTHRSIIGTALIHATLGGLMGAGSCTRAAEQHTSLETNVWQERKVEFVSPIMLAQAVYDQPHAPLVAEVLGTRVHTSDPEEMKYVILKTLLDQYVVDRAIEVTPAEIDVYVENLRRMAERDRQRQVKRRAEINRRLASETMSAEESQALHSELAALQELLDNTTDNASDAEDSAESREARRVIASAFIRQWKINQALYQHYGGRIIYQQGGPEPLDAYRAFLEERQRQGAFKILDKALEQPFWEYYVNDSRHSFYPPGSEEEARAFTTPWWLMDEPAAGQ